LLISLTAFAGSILNTYDKFAVPAFTPVLLNISMILCAVYLSENLATPIIDLNNIIIIYEFILKKSH
jgi:putative peptidoglycan lipid II flippase